MSKLLSYTPGNDEFIVNTNLNDMPDFGPAEQTYWLNLVGNESKYIEMLKDNFSFNELAVADSLRGRHPPKYEDFGDYTFIILRPIQALSDLSCQFKQVALFIGSNYLVTKTSESVPVIESVWSTYEQKDFDSSRSVRHIVYQIFRKVADDYLSVVYEVESRLEEIEDVIENDAKEIYLTELTKYNSSLRKVIRNLEYQEKVARSLIEHEAENTYEQISHEYKDVYEQIDRTLTLARMYQGLCSDLINTHISITSHKVNQVVKLLTIVTVLFLPLSFIVGLYGMNFEFIPELKLKYGYFYVLGVMVVIEIFLIAMLRKLKWI